jgi:zinc transport system substrate-binding protein
MTHKGIEASRKISATLTDGTPTRFPHNRPSPIRHVLSHCTHQRGQHTLSHIALLVALLFSVLLGFALSNSPNVYSKSDMAPSDSIKVFVSILPQVSFAERVGGERVDVSVMVGPGQSPATYEPRPKQMAELNKARLYFRIGVPFENVWMERISKANPNMKVIDTRRGIELLSMKAHHRHDDEAHHDHGNGMKDPHIWLSPRLVKIQAEAMCAALIAEDSAHRSYYESNLRAFQADLDQLDSEISEILKPLKTRKFMVFHPALGYFARDYALEEIPIQSQGKEPSAKILADLIEQAKEEGIKVVFVQQQFGHASAKMIARAIGGKVVYIDPLARDYLGNMRKIAETFAKVMQ